MSKSFAKTKRAAEATRAILADAFPKCFAPKGAAKLPIAVGLHHEILAALPELGFHRLSAALGDYTGGPTYLRNVVEGAPRIGLHGEIKGVVTADQAAHAAKRMEGFEAWAKSQPKVAPVEQAA